MRKIIRKILILILYYSGFNYLYSFFVRDSFYVLAHHSISSPKNTELLCGKLYSNLSMGISRFEERIIYLKKRGHTFVAFKDLENYKEKRWSKPTILYFDDGFKDVLLNALPVLEKYNIPTTVFIGTGITNKQNTIPSIKRCLGLGKENFDMFLSWDDVRFLADKNIEIGAHGVSHARLTNFSAEEAENEIKNSKREIENKINKKIISFSYPHGEWNENINKIVEKAGYKFAVSVGHGLNKTKDFSKGFHPLKNINLSVNDSIVDFKVKLYSWNIVKKFL